jgi:hypothetical protein
MSTRPDMPGEATPGMHRWPDTTTTNHEGAEPMTDTTRAAAGEELHETESDTEQQMRADFMHAESFVARSPEDYDPADEVGYSEYASPWLSGGDRWANEWLFLSDASLRWRDDPAAAETIMRHRESVMSPIERRSEEQARYIAEHGIERDEHGLLTSHYVTRVEDRAATTASPLADYRPGNALAATLANTERDGVER